MSKRSYMIKPLLLFGLNFVLMIISWNALRTTQGDEYLVLFMIPLVFIVAPFILRTPLIAVLFFINVAFFTMYRVIGALNSIDIFLFACLLAGAGSGSYLIRALYLSFSAHQINDITNLRKQYNAAVNDLEDLEHRGRKRESEFTRTSRLYEITKRLAPVLKLEDLLNALVDFLDENFNVKTAHLLTFKEEKFLKGMSKSISEGTYPENDEDGLDYEKDVNYTKKHDTKPFFIDREDDPDLFDEFRVRSDKFMVFPLFIGDKLCSMLAVEEASKMSYGRFRILMSQIALEFRKVELYEQVQELSIVDGLTEVYLRRYLMDRLEEEVDRADRLGLTFSIGMVDVDHFKECNDKYGHLVGDAVLRKIAERLKRSVREVDMIARYGGEEFCVVLPETSKKIATVVAERFRTSIESKRIKAFDEEIRKTVSVGIATYPEDGIDVDTLIEKADTALYKAKRKGRNLVCKA